MWSDGQDLLAELPAARDEAMRRLYGDELFDDLERLHRASGLLEYRLASVAGPYSR